MTVCEWCGGEVPDDAGPCPLSFECPHCHAPPGSPCKRPSGHGAAQMHAGRRKLEFEPPPDVAAKPGGV